MSTQRGLLLLTILCFVLKFNVAEIRVAREKQIEATMDFEIFFDDKLFLTSDTFGHLTYLLCDRNATDKNCTVVQGTEPETSCSVTLKPTHLKFVSDHADVVPLGTTKVALVWAESDSFLPITPVEYYIKYTIVDLTTCESKHMELEGALVGDYRLPFAHYAVYNNSFAIIYKDNVNEYAFYDKYVVDAEGIAAVDNYWVLVYENRDVRFLPIVANSTELKGHVLLHNIASRYDREIGHELLIIKTDDTKKVLRQFPEDDRVLNPIHVSTAHNTIGVAKANHSVIEVAQFDQDGHLKLNVTLKQEVDASALRLYNLATGGCLLAVKSYNASNNETDLYQVLKVSAEGEVAGTVRIEIDRPSPSCKETSAVKVFENERNEYCLATVCRFNKALDDWRVDVLRIIDLKVKYFTDEDFSITHDDFSITEPTA